MTYARAQLQVYLLSHAVERQLITEFLNTRPEILNWYSIFPGSVLVVSRTDLVGLVGIFHASHPQLHFHLTRLDETASNGYMNPEVWDFINNPRSSGRWE